jgi:Protein of unknown function (DUF2938)
MRGLREDVLAGCVAGTAATLAMDAAGVLARKLGWVPEEDIGTKQLGRWIGYMSKGKFVHDQLSEEPPLRMKRELGLATHYLIGMVLGVGYMGLLRVFGARPRIRTAWAYGTASTVFPWFVIYPAYGLGRFGLKNGDRRLLGASLGAHALFGLCLGIATTVMRGRNVPKSRSRSVNHSLRLRRRAFLSRVRRFVSLGYKRVLTAHTAEPGLPEGRATVAPRSASARTSRIGLGRAEPYFPSPAGSRERIVLRACFW